MNLELLTDLAKYYTDPELIANLYKVEVFAYRPKFRGRPMTRQVVQLGKKYYWDKVIDDTNCLEFWKNYFNIPTEYNSCLVNLYDKSQSISWHTDNIKNVVEGSKVISISFSPTNSSKKLGVMKFKSSPTDTEWNKSIDLYHNTRLEFDPYEHNRNKILHTARSVEERYNFTFRQLY
jgi:hypothetical protein